MFSALSVPSVGRAPAFESVSFFPCLLALLVALSVLPPPGAAQTTQTLSLDEGWNLVSLRVQPDDASFASIFGGTDGAISSVKNEDGAAYLPDLGIEQISTWRADEGYKVHAETATTIKIVGTELSPGSVAIALEEGGNIVPYLPDRAQAVEEALMSIDESLVAVEGEDGRRYPSGSTPLDSLRPGQGYKVYVDRADTLRYPAVTKTLNDALALKGMDVGSYVRVQGYHKPGDNGGGLFQVKNTACRSDGATCFIFDEDLSNQQEVKTGDRLGSPYSLPDSDLSFRSVRLKYGPGANQYLPALELYGHSGVADAQGALDTKAGTIGGAGGALLGQKRNWGGGDDYDWRIRYKYATSDRRLVRTGVTNAFNIDWWGGTTRVGEGWTQEWVGADASALEFAPSDDNTAQINWATNRAARAVRENSGIDAAFVDFPGMYWKLFRTLQPDNVQFRGTGSARTIGNVTVKGGFKMPPGLAMWHDLEAGSNSHLGTAWNRWERARIHKFGLVSGDYPENMIGLGENFEINGGLDQNMQVFNNLTDYGGANNKLQNGGRWAGWRTSDRGSETEGSDTGYLEGVRLKGRDVAVRKTGGNLINTSVGSVVLDVDGLFLGTAQRNHTLYGMAGPGTGQPSIATDIQYSGTAWAASVKLGVWKDSNQNQNELNQLSRKGASAQWGSTYTNFVAKNMEPNDIYGGPGAVFNLEQSNVDFDGFTIDFKSGGLDGGAIFRNLWFGNLIKNGTIKIPQNGGVTLHDVRSNALWSFLDAEITEFSDITVEGDGDFRLHNRQETDATNTIYRNITISANGSSEGFRYAVGGGMGLLEPTSRPSGLPPGATRVVHDNVSWNGDYEEIARFAWPNAPGGDHLARDMFVINSSINNAGDWSISLDKRAHAEAAGRDERIYMSNTTFNVPLSSLEWQDQFHYALSPNPTVTRNTPNGDWIVEDGPTIRLRNCDTPNGRVSDSVGNTFTSSASDEGNDFVLIPTSLLGRPFEINTTLTSSPSGISSITSVEVANSDGSLRPDDTQLEHDPYLKVNLDGTIGSGETVTIDWTARVTPLDQYSTTGLFISRPVPSKTFTSGNGPFTVDLRGVAASQETWTPPAYSTSSSDTGVVTANVTASNHRGTDRFYTLELTEQGTGTATITIDASISGVGMATTTFEVTVE